MKVSALMKKSNVTGLIIVQRAKLDVGQHACICVKNVDQTIKMNSMHSASLQVNFAT
jgi:hypothetical protein